MDKCIQDLIIKKLDSLEGKIDRNTTAFNDFRLKVVKEQAVCKADCKNDITKMKFSLFKLVATIGASGTVGGGVSHLITKLF